MHNKIQNERNMSKDDSRPTTIIETTSWKPRPQGPRGPTTKVFKTVENCRTNYLLPRRHSFGCRVQVSGDEMSRCEKIAGYKLLSDGQMFL